MRVADGDDDRQAHEPAPGDLLSAERIDMADRLVFGGLHLDLSPAA